jgi:hypothetical protein
MDRSRLDLPGAYYVGLFDAAGVRLYPGEAEVTIILGDDELTVALPLDDGAPDGEAMAAARSVLAQLGELDRHAARSLLARRLALWRGCAALAADRRARQCPLLLPAGIGERRAGRRLPPGGGRLGADRPGSAVPGRASGPLRVRARLRLAARCDRAARDTPNHEKRGR